MHYIKKFYKKLICSAAAISMCIAAVFFMMPLTQANAAETDDDYTPIYTYEDLLEIQKDPEGKYKLMCDIDLMGKDWKPVDFNGVFDGNGHAILNCTVDSVTEDTRLTYDGNMISYDTVFSGFFGIVEGAEISDLSLLGFNIDLDVEADCFAGGLCGYTAETVISNCTLKGNVTLYVYGRMFGVGGAIGYGSGEIKDSTVDTTLILVDTDVEDKDEQFMGGVNGNGYLSIEDCDVTIRGYDSDHGYVHNGGLSGMYILYPEGTYHWDYITGNTITGFITFFEDNEDRRAYCYSEVGEDMSSTFDDYDNEADFERDEVYEYDTNLLPHYCEDPEYDAEITNAECPDYGFTTYTCKECGYSYNADYTAPEHSVNTWTTVKEADTSSEGLKKGKCAICGTEVYEIIPVQEETETTTEETTEEETTETSVTSETSEQTVETTSASEETTKADENNGTFGKMISENLVLVIIIVVLFIVFIVLVIVMIRILRKNKKRR